MLENKSILIIVGTGSFGKKFTKRVLEQFEPKKLLFTQEKNISNI